MRFIKYVIATLILAVVSSVLMLELGLRAGYFPDTRMTMGSELRASVIDDLEKAGIKHPGENIRMFFSEDLISFVSYGNFSSNKRLVSYEMNDANTLKIYEASFDQIDEISLGDVDASTNSVYAKVGVKSGEHFYLMLSTEDNMHKTFMADVAGLMDKSRMQCDNCAPSRGL